MSDVIGLYLRFGVRLPDPNFRDGWVSCRCFTGRHVDRHPSARIHLQSGGFRCFTCNQAGGVLDALELLGVTRDEARQLANDYGILDDTPKPRRRPPLPGIHHAQPRPQPEPVKRGPVDYDHLAPVRERAWEYHDENGQVVGRVKRVDLADGTKRIWQEHPENGGWQPGMQGAQLPLYRLPEVLDHADRGAQIVVVEGEKAVDALDRIGVFATTSPGGAGKWRPEHTSQIAGLRASRDRPLATVIPIADCDQPGRDHARHIATSLLTINHPCRMPVDLAAWRHDGFDVVDYLAELATTVRAIDPNVTDLHERLRTHLQRILDRALPATTRDLQLREELDRHRTGDGTTLAWCTRCKTDRVHKTRAGTLYCPCGHHRPP